MVTKHTKIVLVLLVNQSMHSYKNSNLSCVNMTDLKKNTENI